jgi:hypothetical protein
MTTGIDMYFTVFESNTILCVCKLIERETHSIEDISEIIDLI